jgi:hypothetical protein
VWQRLEKQQARESVWQRLSDQRRDSPASSECAVPRRRRLVWVKINTPEVVAKMEDSPRMAAGEESHRSLRNKRKRRRSKHGKGSKKPVAAPGQASPISSDEAIAPKISQPPDQRPGDQGEMGWGTRSACILEFSDDMAREEANLRRALFVTIVGTRPIVTDSEVIDEVAHSFNIKTEDMKIHQTKPEDFLLFLPDEATATRVLNDGKILKGPRFSLIFKRWTRCSHASSSIMPGLVDIEIRGIPEHAWFLSTAKSILTDSCLIAEVHPDSLSKRELSSFVVRAWCFNPENLQRDSVLHIIEPGLQMFEKRCLTYKIQIRVLHAGSHISPEGLPPSADGDKPPWDDDGNDDHGTHPRRPIGSLVLRKPLHLRLGPMPAEGCGTEASAPPGASKAGPWDTGRDMQLTLGTDMSPTPKASLRDVVHLTTCIDGSPVSEAPLHENGTPSGRDMQLTPGTDMSPTSTAPLRDVEHLMTGTDGSPASEAPLHEDRTPSSISNAAGKVLSGKINSPRSSFGPGMSLGPDPPRCLVGPLETTGPVSVSPQVPVGPLETCISMPVSPQLRCGPLETNALAYVSPQLASGYPKKTGPISLQLTEMAGTMAATRDEATKALKVYFRRRTKANLLQLSQNEETEEGSVQNNDSLHSAPRTMNHSTTKDEFFRKISTTAEQLLPAPKQDMNALLSSNSSREAAPRRSRRIAGAGVEFNMHDWGSRATKQALRALHIISEAEGTSQEATEAYARVFKQPLSHSQVKALAALFGWTPPPDLVY